MPECLGPAEEDAYVCGWMLACDRGKDVVPGRSAILYFVSALDTAVHLVGIRLMVSGVR